MPRTHKRDDLLDLLRRIFSDGDWRTIPPEPSRWPIVTRVDLGRAIIDLLAHAARRGTFTSLSFPCWSGWATADAVGWHLPDRIKDARLDTGDWASDHVEPLMLMLGEAGRLERRRIHPLRFRAHPAAREVECWAFRLPGDAGYCRLEPGTPVMLGQDGLLPRPDGTTYSVLEARQIKELKAELAEMGCQLPPYWLARIERVALRHLEVPAVRVNGRSFAASHSGLRNIR